MTKRKVGRPRTSDRIRKELLLSPEDVADLDAIAKENNLVVTQGKYKDQPNINAAVIWLIDLWRTKQ